MSSLGKKRYKFVKGKDLSMKRKEEPRGRGPAQGHTNS
jgi:hypothetical protein